MNRGQARTACAGALLAIAVLAGVRLGIPDPWEPPSPAAIRSAHRPSDARLLSRDGALVHQWRIDPHRRVLPWTPLDRISPILIEAVLHSEDRRFFEHPGVDPLALAGALRDRLLGTSRRGASTLSMQLTALIDPSLRPRNRRRTLREKWEQMHAALALEASWSKQEILETYLNLVPFRGEVEGVTAAAGVLLGKEPHGIERAEAALLAALLRGPSAPPEVVLERVRRGGFGRDDREGISRAASRIFATPDRSPPILRDAPHLARRLATESPEKTTLHSTIDGPLQQFAARALAHEIGRSDERNLRDGAAVVLDNATGEVLAYVGSGGARASAPYVDGVRARRQAGSTLKPFLYGLMIDRRLVTAASLLEDSPLEIPLGPSIYRPRNYDQQYRGQVSLRSALAGSLNIPAVRSQKLVGEPAFLDLLLRLGFEGLETGGDHYGPSLILGSAGVSLLELANAYRALARGGVWSPVRWTMGHTDSARDTRVLSTGASFILAQILSDREARSGTFGLESPLSTRFWSAVKTGTSREMRDNWCVGFSADYTVAVWVGNASGEPMHDVSGVTGAAPVWRQVLSYLHRERPGTPPSPPAGVVRASIDLPSEPRRDEWFLVGTEPRSPTIVPARHRPSILSPVDKTILALDPDIPPTRQRLTIVARFADASLSWELDGEMLGSADRPILWEPRTGNHRLRLLGHEGEPVDEVVFEVRSGGQRVPVEGQPTPPRSMPPTAAVW
jgi:penicillin-binding protein 1C